MAKVKEKEKPQEMTEFEARLEMLKLPFNEVDYEWRYNNIAIDYRDNAQRQLFLVYVTNRAIMNRLDECIGAANWKVQTFSNLYHKPCNKWAKVDKGESKEFQEQAIMFTCTISIWNPDIEQWISKADGAEGTAFESIKGGFSSAMKRAAVQWGIGRLLYGITDCFAITSSMTRDSDLHKSYKNSERQTVWALPPRLPSSVVNNYDKTADLIYSSVTGTDDTDMQNIPLGLAT